MSFIQIVQSPSPVWFCATQQIAAHQASLSLSKFMSIELVMLAKHLLVCCCLLLLPPIFPSIRVSSNELAVPIRWPKYWNFSVSPSSEYSGLISLRIDWFDLLAVQETLKSLLQHCNSKASIFLALNLPYCPALTSVHDYWYNHSFDYMDLCWQCAISAF